jgi:hypothetical protein
MVTVEDDPSRAYNTSDQIDYLMRDTLFNSTSENRTWVTRLFIEPFIGVVYYGCVMPAIHLGFYVIDFLTEIIPPKWLVNVWTLWGPIVYLLMAGIIFYYLRMLFLAVCKRNIDKRK